MVTNDSDTAIPPKDFLVKDYELKVRYLTDHFGRMCTVFPTPGLTRLGEEILERIG